MVCVVWAFTAPTEKSRKRSERIWAWKVFMLHKYKNISRKDTKFTKYKPYTKIKIRENKNADLDLRVPQGFRPEQFEELNLRNHLIIFNQRFPLCSLCLCRKSYSLFREPRQATIFVLQHIVVSIRFFEQVFKLFLPAFNGNIYIVEDATEYNILPAAT